LSGGFDAAGGGRDCLKPETVCGDDAIVEDVLDVGLGCEAAQGGGVVLGGGLEGGVGFDGGDAEVFVALDEMGAGGGDAGFGVAGDGGVAIEDEVAVRCDARGVDLGIDLGAGETGEEDRQDEGSVAQAADCACNGDGKSRRRKIQVGGNGHGCTSLFR
jgi:hypothetical protein